MTVKELINKLEEFDGDLQVMNYDSVYEEVEIRSVEDKLLRSPLGDKFIVLID